MPKLEMQKTMPKLGMQETIPKLGMQKTMPKLGMQETMPKLGMQETIPNLPGRWRSICELWLGVVRYWMSQADDVCFPSAF